VDQFPSRLINGYGAFRKGRLAADRARYRVLAEAGQRPEIMIIGCSDSRAAPETIFDAAPGEMFVLRNVANLVPPHDPDGEYHGTSAAIEFAVMSLRIRHIVVMGHGRCGGVEAFLSGRGATGEFIGKWISLLEPAAALVADEPKETATRQRMVEFASIRHALANLLTFPPIADLVQIGELHLHGAWFDISTGELLLLDRESGAFAPVGDD
jgi:carbonic anhydrase